jgi:hypothetical protein
VIRFSPGLLPSPSSLRLLFRGTRPSLKPPFGLAAWSDDEAADIVVALEHAKVGGDTGEPLAGEILPQLPVCETLRRGALVIVLADVGASSGFLRFLVPRAKVSRAARAAALLAAGYVQLGGGLEPKSGHDLVWGYSPGEGGPVAGGQ